MCHADACRHWRKAADQTAYVEPANNPLNNAALKPARPSQPHLQVEQLLYAGDCLGCSVNAVAQQVSDGLPVSLTQEGVAQVADRTQDLL